MFWKIWFWLYSNVYYPADVVKESASLLDVDYKAKENQKEDSELVIGEAASNIISTISEKKRARFFENVRDYYVKACDYLRHKFPFTDEVVIHAEMANLDKITKLSFNSVKYFVERFPVLQKTLNYNEKNKFIDALQAQFYSLQVEEIPECIKC